LDHIYDFLPSASRLAVFSRTVASADAACNKSDLPNFDDGKKIAPPKP
jgi:hypothetical protein